MAHMPLYPPQRGLMGKTLNVVFCRRRVAGMLSGFTLVLGLGFRVRV